MRSRKVMEKIGLKYDKKYDFYHPNLDKQHELCLHALYQLNQADDPLYDI